MSADTLISLYALSNNLRHTVSDKRDTLCNSISRFSGYCIVDHDKDPEFQSLGNVLSKINMLSHTINAAYQALTNSCDYIWEGRYIEHECISFDNIPLAFDEMTIRVNAAIQSSTDDTIKSNFMVISNRLLDAERFYARYIKKFAGLK